MSCRVCQEPTESGQALCDYHFNLHGGLVISRVAIPPTTAESPALSVDTPASPKSSSLSAASVVKKAPRRGSKQLNDTVAKEWWEDRKEGTTNQFGVPIADLAAAGLRGYSAPIPKVLMLLKGYLTANSAETHVGIFRLAPDSSACDVAKQQINEGKLDVWIDGVMAANLIKVWVRELPSKLWNGLDPKAVPSDVSSEQAGEIIGSLAEPCLSITLWVLDVCVEIVKHKEVNQMDSKNLAIVFGPNLSLLTSDPLLLFEHAKQFTKLFEKAIDWRSKEYSELNLLPRLQRMSRGVRGL